MALERETKEGESPVDERDYSQARILSTTGHANLVGIRGVHVPRLNILFDR